MNNKRQPRDPDLQTLLDRADEVFKEMNDLLHGPAPDFNKLKELDDEGRVLTQRMSATVQNRAPHMYQQRSGERTQQ
jgi:hypothetical protein